jgi:hypothetical protein
VSAPRDPIDRRPRCLARGFSRRCPAASAAAGATTELHVYPGADHASEVFAPEAPPSRRIMGERSPALRKALHPEG